MHTIGGEEAIIDSLTQTVLVNGVSEVEIGVAVIIAQRRRRHAQLKGRLEMLKDRAPGTVITRAATMAFVHDDKVKEVRRVISEQAFTALILGERLIDGKIHLAAEDDFAGGDLVARIAERRERLVLGIVDQNIPVGKEENSRLTVLACPVPAA